VFVPFSHELGQDWNSLAQELARLAADGRDVLDSDKFLNGSGTNEPAGIFTGLTTSQRIQGTAGELTIAAVYRLKQALPARFAANGTFAYNSKRLDDVFQAVGGGSTQPPLLPSREGALLGRPKVEWSALDGTSTTGAGTKVAIYADFQSYLVADRLGMQAEIIPHLFGGSQRPTGQRGFWVMWRTATKVLVPNAFRYLEIV
jgi:HK97 family phage major capsid protein